MRSHMPQRIYRGQEPPRKRDHLLAHPYEVLIAIGGLAAGALLLLSEVGAPTSISPTMEGLPDPVSWLIGVSGVIGNALILVGLLNNDDDLMKGWTLERAGLVGAITSWGCYSLAVATLFPGSVISYGLTLCVAVSHTIRLAATMSEEGATRSAIHETGGR